ncbi:hypothetical protein PPYR_09905 [Photinus pyralis]|uniref:Peptidoglycan recognition protein family domain-containing protein n=1 Tax=Photinus pyralis TaxID=7054 RepID=A0A1Y1MV54_PHOPY|nr:peptidoglycan-recognition protein LA-like [Photinus pyralis]KAB0795844.1 hypothetical protein PPYR_09905 [Photinus pyralis]
MANLTNDACKVNKETSDDNVLSVHPIVIDAVNTSVVPRSSSDSSDDEDDDDSEECGYQLDVRSNGLTPGSTVQIENSSDVVIGPVTQFHGPVTIYQNVRAEAQQLPQIAQKKSSPEKSNLDDNSSPKKYSLIKVLEKSPTKRLLLYSFLALSTFTLIVFGIVWSLKMFDKTDTNSESTPKEREETIIRNSTTYTKEEWRGEPASGEIARLSLPVEYVVVAHTAGSFCESFADCSYIIRNIQHLHMQKHKDIWYNFLIGGDGAIYFGRGWNLKSTSGDNAIIVTFIGEFQRRHLTSGMVSALEQLLASGLSLQKLASDYKLVGHNQTKPTESPGANAYERISKMPHFYGGGVKLKQSVQ